MKHSILLLVVVCFATLGCKTTGKLPSTKGSDLSVSLAQLQTAPVDVDIDETSDLDDPQQNQDGKIQLVAFQESSNGQTEDNGELGIIRKVPPVNNEESLSISEVLQSTFDFFPAIQEAFRLEEIARGEQLAAQGNFDTKFKLASENTPVGFYETYRQNVGVELPTLQGGSVFGGYRLGRGDMEPWYLERNTNAGGEFKVGARWAFLRGRDIDQRRVEVWQANWRRQAVEPKIRRALIEARQFAEFNYWSWVAAGQVLRLNQRILDIAVDRQEGIVERIDAGDLAEINGTDNERTVVSRRAKFIQSNAKFNQSAAKLSLFYRDSNGNPLTAGLELVPDFPKTDWLIEDSVASLVNMALGCRPEVALLNIDIEKIGIDIVKARNDLLPRVDFELATSQDVGRPTSASAAASSSGAVFANFNEKDEFKVDASLFVNQALERRKARGKIRSLCGKREQLQIKLAFLEEKIRVEIQQAYALLDAAIKASEQARKARDLTRELSDAARERYDSGDVDLFELILREQQEIDAANRYVQAMLELFASRARLNAAIGCNFEDF